MSPEEIAEIEVYTPEPCRCEHYALLCANYAEVMHAKSHNRQAESYGQLIVICGTFICLILFCFFLFLMLSSWFERKVTMEMAIIATMKGIS